MALHMFLDIDPLVNIPFSPTNTNISLQILTGRPCALILVFNLKLAPRQPIKSPLSMVPPFHPKITSRNPSSPTIQCSTSLIIMNLLLQTPSRVTHLLSMMEVPWLNSYVSMIPLSVMPMASRTPSSSLTPSTSGRSIRKSLTSFKVSSPPKMNHSPTINIRTSLKIAMVIPNAM